MRGARPLVLLLRGVNVGGRVRLPMAELRALLDEMGLPDSRTHLQSGNVVVAATAARARALGAELQAAIAERLGVTTRVLARTAADMAEIVEENPFADEAAAAPASVHVAFLDAAPDAAAVARLDPDRSPGDRFAVRGSEVYLHYPHGSGRSKLTADYLERTLGVTATARNWRTVTALWDMTIA